MKATRFVLISWVAIVSLGMTACQGPSLLSAPAVMAEPTAYSPPPTISSTVTPPAPTPVPPTPRTIPAQAHLLANLPAKGELMQRANPLAWSPDGNSLAYLGPAGAADSLVGDLMLVESPHFETPRRSASNVVGDPSWSPDGSRIAFVAFRPDDQQHTVMVVNTDGSDLRDLFSGEAARTDPGIGYKAIGGWLDENSILIMTNCGSGCIRPLRLDLQYDTSVPMFPTGQEGARYAWSPDRNHVVVTAGFNPQIGVAAEAGDGIAWLSGHGASDPAWERFWTFFGDWAPDESRFLFLRQPDDASEPPTLWVWNLGTLSGAPLLPGVVAASWSPEGDVIAFLNLGQPRFGANGTWQGTVGAPDGPNTLGIGLYQWRKKQIIAFAPAGEVGIGYRWPDQLEQQLLKPVWAPAGHLLAYQDGTGAVWILSADDLTQYKLDIAETSISGLSWSPDGKKLAISTSESLMVFSLP